MLIVIPGTFEPDQRPDNRRKDRSQSIAHLLSIQDPLHTLMDCARPQRFDSITFDGFQALIGKKKNRLQFIQPLEFDS